MDQETQLIMARVAKLGEMSEGEAHRIVNEIYTDGIVSRGEAEALFRLQEMLSATDPMWKSRFHEALLDYLLTREPPEGHVTDEEADWVLAQVSHDGDEPSLEEIDLLTAILRRAEGAPVKLARYTLDAIAARVIADRSASAEMVERARLALFAGAGDGGLWVSQYEAAKLFEINDAIGKAKNAESWNDLFARAVGNHLMARAHPAPQSVEAALAREAWLQDTTSSAGGFFSRMGASFLSGKWFEKVTFDQRRAARARQTANEAAAREAEKVTQEEHAWLIERFERDGDITPAERALIAFLQAEAPGFAQGLAVAA